jgi:hypothetical protein
MGKIPASQGRQSGQKIPDPKICTVFDISEDSLRPAGDYRNSPIGGNHMIATASCVERHSSLCCRFLNQFHDTIKP